MKRKDLDEVNDKFSGFSLRACARKIRILDAELPPIVEDEEFEISMVFKQSVRRRKIISRNFGGLEIEEPPHQDGKKAIVLFKPMKYPLLNPPSNISVSVDSCIVLALKNHANQVSCSSQANSRRLDNEDSGSNVTNSCPNKGSLVVVPWIPAALPSRNDSSDVMDTEENEGAMMDVEDNSGVDQMKANEAGVTATGQLHQWQQQHCKIPQLPHLSTTPISWHG